MADITFVPTGSGFLYLAVAMDAFSRRIVGWAMAGHLRTELVLAALEMAFGQRCREAGGRPSTGSVGDCYDNALCESFFATLDFELIERRRFATKAEARMAIFTYIEGWNNPRRRHSGFAYHSPVRFEENYLTEPKTPAKKCPLNRRNSRLVSHTQ